MSETYAFGIDVGGTTIKHGLFNGKGELLESWEIPTRTEENGKNILPDIAASIRGKMKEKSITAADVKGVGIVRMAPMDVIRHEVVTRIVEAYGDWEAKKKKAKAKAEAERQGKA